VVLDNQTYSKQYTDLVKIRALLNDERADVFTDASLEIFYIVALRTPFDPVLCAGALAANSRGAMQMAFNIARTAKMDWIDLKEIGE